MQVSERLTAARGYLDRQVFPLAPPGAPLTARRSLLYAAFALLGVTVQLLRTWSLDPLEHVFGEDGFVYLADAQGNDGLSSLTTAYNGYLQVSSRLVAAAVAGLPVDWYAAAMAIFGALIVTGCAFVVWRTSAAQIRDRYLRGTLAAMVFLLGALGTEMLGNVVNTIFACFWLLLWRPRIYVAAAFAGAGLLLGALSIPRPRSSPPSGCSGRSPPAIAGICS